MPGESNAVSGGNGDQNYGHHVALIVRRVARTVAVPALLLMFGGLLLYGVSSEYWPVRFGMDLAGPETARLVLPGPPLAAPRSGEMAMSLGLLALALVPAVTVLLVLLDHLRGRRWREAAVATSVVMIMAISVILGKK